MVGSPAGSVAYPHSRLVVSLHSTYQLEAAMRSVDTLYEG